MTEVSVPAARAASEDGRLADLLPDAVLRLDPAGRIVDANTMASHLTGYPGTTLVGAVCAELLDPQTPDGRPLLAEGFHRSARLRSVTGLPEQAVRLLRADGAEITAFVTGSYQRNGDGEVIGATVALREAGRRAHQTPTGMEIVSTVSHELRSPLTSVKGFSSTLLRRWGRFTDDQKRLMLQTIEADADRVTRLITELLDISRIDAGRLQVRKQPVDVAGVIDRHIERFVASGHERERFHLMTPAADLPETWADPDRLDQILANLMENAVRHGDGMVSLEVRATDPGPDQALVVTVGDEGEGISPDHYPLVFTRFWHGSRRGGTGLGLYVVRGLVEAHGGKIEVDRAPGGGALFRFTLPAGVPAHNA
jgi:PAS domain S-box-containing protein